MSEIQTAYIEEEMEESYINYAMSVIRGRAIPDVRDGLKPVQRRILYGLHDLGLTPDKSHKKSARIVGEVLGKYHPHGDQAVYDTMVNMAQEFSFRYPLVDGQGNFGSIDGDAAAAMRYTEARLASISESFLDELNEETVDFQPNFDDSLEEPIVMPAKLPSLLLNGAWGISVGMTTKVPAHNLTEVVEGLIYLIDNPQASLENLMKYIKGPDFPTGGIILGRDGIENAYRTGKGRIRMRARTKIEGERIIITEIPFQVKKSTIIERIADKTKDGTIEGISDVRDESDRDGMRIVISLKRNAEPEVVLNCLFKYTPLERTYGANFTVIVDGNPRRLSLKELLNFFIDFRRQVVRRRSQYRLKQAKERAHILEGLRTALENSERIIELIRSASDRSGAANLLSDQFRLSDEQIDAILNMRLRRLTSLERDNITEELKEKREDIERHESILSSTTKLDDIIKEELRELKEEFGDERRTLITEKVEELDAEKLIPDHSLIVQVTEEGFVNAPRRRNYKTQGRAGKGVICMRVSETDRLFCSVAANSRDDLLLFSDQDNAYRTKAYKLPSNRRDSRGESLRDFFELKEGEKIETLLNVGGESVEEGYCLIGTRGGLVSKNPLEDLSSAYVTGVRAINSQGGDKICSAVVSYGGSDIFIASRQGQVIRFEEEELRTTQRPSKGVIGIDLAPADQVVGMDKFSEDEVDDKKLLFVTEKGLGKKVPLSEFSRQGRGGRGNLGIKVEEEDGLKAIRLVDEGEEVMLCSEGGKAIRLQVNDVNQFQRYARGVKLMELEDMDRVVSVTVI